MTFEEALKALKDGKKVKRDYFLEDSYWFFEKEILWHRSMITGHSVSIAIGTVLIKEILATDWEIME